MIVIGGFEVVIMLFLFVGFCVMKVMLINFDLNLVCRLFDKDRDGFVMGEGGVIFILEEFEYVKKWGVKIYVEVVGYGVLDDVYYIIVFDLEGEGFMFVM